MTVLFRDDFTGDDSSFYGRSPDGVNFSPEPVTWAEDTDTCFTQGGFLQTTGSIYEGQPDQAVLFAPGGGVCEYEDGGTQTLTFATDPHEMHVGVYNEGTGTTTRVTTAFAAASGVDRWTVLLYAGDKIDYFIITTPGHVFEAPVPPVWELTQTLDNPTPELFDQFGSQVDISGDYAIVGARRDNAGATDAGTVYIYCRTGTAWALQATLNNPAVQAEANFGAGVGINGDYAVVGADLTDATGLDEGVVYIYYRTGTTWALQATLSNPTIGAFEYFGRNVAIHEGYVIVGAPRSNTALANSGSAYIYYRTGTTWTLQATLNNPTPATYDWFGNAVAIDGAYAVVGAFSDDTGATDAGSAYIYYRTGTAWALQATLNNPVAQAYERFGVSVAIHNDYVVVGANGVSDTRYDIGAAYIYYRTGTTWALQATLNNPAPTEYAEFGQAVAVDESVVVVGAFGSSVSAEFDGAAYTYVRSGSGWSLQQTLQNPAPDGGDFFGVAVAVSGGYVVVGAQANAISGTAVGSAYMYVLSGVAVEATGVSTTVASGTAVVSAGASASPSGVVVEAATGDAGALGDATVRPTAVSASARSGYPLVWSVVDDAQTPGWTPVK